LHDGKPNSILKWERKKIGRRLRRSQQRRKGYVLQGHPVSKAHQVLTQCCVDSVLPYTDLLIQVAALQKKKKAAAEGVEKSPTKGKKKDTDRKDETPKSPTKAAANDEENDEADIEEQERATAVDVEKATEAYQAQDLDLDEAAFNDAMKSVGQPDDPLAESAYPSSPTQEATSISAGKSRHPVRQASVSLQSKLRSTSFRDTAPGPASPSVGSLQRIEELEFENRRLAQESAEHESRWRKTEEELEELREDSVNNQGSEIEKMKAEIEALRRQQRQGADSAASGQRKGSRRDSIANGLTDDSASLRKELESKDSTIADMQLEISRLRSQLSSQTQGCETHGEQISALESSLSSAETKLRKLETEHSDTKKSLARASEKAMIDGTERTSKDTKIRNLETDMAEAIAERDEVVKKSEQLEKKVEAMNKLHREAEARSSSKLSTVEQASREVPSLRAKIERLQSENTRLREKHKRSMSGGGADDGLDELEDEERTKLEKRIRELESQVFDLQRGLWRDKRTALQPDIAAGSRSSFEQGVEGDFDEVDLTGHSGSTTRRASALQRTISPQSKHSNFTQYLSSGLNAFLPSTTSPEPGNRPRNDSLLEEFDGDEAFDEAAFAQAQREEDAKKMLEHVREVKRGLKNWKGWRLDLVDARRGEPNGWEIFEV
jgi:DNA repair exonuclease SbcCD ATPase subunit